MSDRKDWPLWARTVALAASRNDWGVGDTIARIGRIFLIGSAYRAVFRNCGCEKRQSDLNNKYPYAMQATDQEFFDERKTVVVELFKPGCQHCTAMVPVVEEVSSELPDFRFLRVDGNKRADLIEKFHVRVSPSYLVFSSGKLVGKFSGSSDKQTFLSRIKNPVLPESTKLYELNGDQVSRLLSCINNSTLKGSEAEFFVGLKKALQTPFEKR